MNSAKTELKETYSDVAMATGSIRWFVAYLENELGNCQNVENHKCYTWWRHDECFRLMNILNDLTGDEKYLNVPMRGNSWD